MLIVIVVGSCALVVGVWSLIYVAPVLNRWLSHVWEDPSESQRRELVQRLKELHVDGNVPEETAVLMAAREMGTDEAEVLKMLGHLNAHDIKAVLTGKKTLPGVFFSKWATGFYKGMGGKS